MFLAWPDLKFSVIGNARIWEKNLLFWWEHVCNPRIKNQPDVVSFMKAVKKLPSLFKSSWNTHLSQSF